MKDPRLLRGRGTFVDDVVCPRMLHGCFVRSPFARARLGAVDAAGALALPGVHAVLTAADLNPGVHEQWYTSMGKDVPDTPRPPLAEGEVRFVGDPVALVVAADRYTAEDAADLVEVDDEPLPAVVDYHDAPRAEARVHERYPGNVAGSLGAPCADDLEAVFAAAAHDVRLTLHQQAYAPVPMETRGLVVEWSGEELTVWAATQAPHEVRMFLARLLGIAEHQVRVIMRDTGGAFGQKVLPMREDMCVALAAMAVPAPIKWIEDRRENLMAAGMSRHEHGDLRMGFDAEGYIVGAYIDHTQGVGAYPTPWPVGTAAAVGMLFPGPYRVPRAGFRTTSVLSNTAGRTAYRGPWQFESVARVVLLDVAARRMGIDPVELRRRNLLRRDELPCMNPNGMPYSDITPAESFEQALAMLDYEAFRRQQAEARDQGRYLGVGTCTYVELTTTGMAYYGTEGATIRIEPSGTVNVYVSGGSTGNSLEAAAVRLTADALGVDIGDVRTVQGDIAVTPFGAGTGGSRSGSMLAGAVAETAGVLRERIVAIAAHLLEAAPDDVELAASRGHVRGTPARAVPLADIADVAYFKPAKLPGGVPAGLEASGRYHARSPIVVVVDAEAVPGQVGVAEGLAQRRPGAELAGRDRDVAPVGAGVDVAGGEGPPAGAGCVDGSGDVLGPHPHGAVDHVGVEARAPAGALGGVEGDQDAGGGHGGGQGQRHDRSGRGRVGVGQPGEPPRGPEVGQVVARLGGEGPEVAEPGDRAPHDVGVPGAHRLVAEP